MHFEGRLGEWTGRGGHSGGGQRQGRVRPWPVTVAASAAGRLLLEVVVSGPEGWRGGWQDHEDSTLRFGLNIKISKNGIVKTFRPSLNFWVRLLAPGWLSSPFLGGREGRGRTPPSITYFITISCRKLCSLFFCSTYLPGLLCTEMLWQMSATHQSSHSPWFPCSVSQRGGKKRETTSISHTTNSANTTMHIQIASLSS